MPKARRMRRVAKTSLDDLRAVAVRSQRVMWDHVIRQIPGCPPSPPHRHLAACVTLVLWIGYHYDCVDDHARLPVVIIQYWVALSGIRRDVVLPGPVRIPGNGILRLTRKRG